MPGDGSDGGDDGDGGGGDDGDDGAGEREDIDIEDDLINCCH